MSKDQPGNETYLGFYAETASICFLESTHTETFHLGEICAGLSLFHHQSDVIQAALLKTIVAGQPVWTLMASRWKQLVSTNYNGPALRRSDMSCGNHSDRMLVFCVSAAASVICCTCVVCRTTCIPWERNPARSSSESTAPSCRSVPVRVCCQGEGSLSSTVVSPLGVPVTGSGLSGAGERDVCHPGRTDPGAKTLRCFPRGTLGTIPAGMIRDSWWVQ